MLQIMTEDDSVIEAKVLGSIPEPEQSALDAVISVAVRSTLLSGAPVEIEMHAAINFTLR